MKQKIFVNKLYIFLIVCIGVILSLLLNCYITGVNNQVIHPLWLITHSSKKWILIWAIIFISAGMLLKFTKFIDYLHRFRYIIGCTLLLVCVCFNINGSSIGNWTKVINDGDQADNGNLVGVSRPIRTDEWNVFTPLALSQEYNDYGYTSEIPRATETDMFMIYGQPVKDISIIFRPFQIGYLFLGSSYGLSFYWMSRLIFLFLFSYEFMLLITRRYKLLSVVGASMIAFAPLIQWWFSTNGYIEMIIAIEVSVLLFDKYMKCEKLWVRMLCTSGIMICAGMFMLTLYPPVMVPLAYILLGLVSWVFFKNLKACNYCWKDFWCTLGVVCVFGVLLARVFYMSWDTIVTVMNTSYPGTREYTGGGLSFSSYFDSIFNILLPFKDKFYTINFSEDARFIDLFPLSYIFVVALMIFKKKNEKLNLLIKIMLPINISLLVISIFPMPGFLMKVTLLAKSSARMNFAVQLSNIIILFAALSQLLSLKSLKLNSLIIVIISILVFLGVSVVSCLLKREAIVLLSKNWDEIKWWIVICSLLLGILVSTGILIIKFPKLINLWAITIIVAVFVAGGLANPVRRGIDTVREQNLSKEIQQIVLDDHDAKWLAEGSMGANFLIANGAKTINSINVYPYLQRWRALDNEDENIATYNRYAHITAEYLPTYNQADKFELLGDDAFRIYYNKEDLKSLGAKYILCPKTSRTSFCNDNSFFLMYEDVNYDIFKYQVQ